MLKELSIGLLLTVCLFSACASNPSNLVGKNFDADSRYCRQLRKSTTQVFRNNLPASNRSRATNPQSAGPLLVSEVERATNMRSYDMDCESVSSYNLRTRSEN